MTHIVFLIVPCTCIICISAIISTCVQVIKGCSSGHFGHGPLVGKFECDFRDVCSRVMRLIRDGYIKRDIGHPHVLVYIPDPSELVQVCQPERERVENNRVIHVCPS